VRAITVLLLSLVFAASAQAHVLSEQRASVAAYETGYVIALSPRLSPYEDADVAVHRCKRKTSNHRRTCRVVVRADDEVFRAKIVVTLHKHVETRWRWLDWGSAAASCSRGNAGGPTGRSSTSNR
jgi:hypothetical protein